MGYLQELRADVTTRLERLDTSCREDVKTLVNFISNAVLDSYRNGEKNARQTARKTKREGKGADAPKGKQHGAKRSDG